MYPTGPEPFWFRAGGPWALGIGLDLTSHSPRCFRMVWMTARSSMKPMIRMIPRHFGQVRGSTFPDQVGDRLRSSGSAGPSSLGIPSNFYRLPGYRGPRRLRFLFAFPGRHYCINNNNNLRRCLKSTGAGKITDWEAGKIINRTVK